VLESTGSYLVLDSNRRLVVAFLFKILVVEGRKEGRKEGDYSERTQAPDSESLETPGVCGNFQDLLT
jgi:hypothetical protein